MSEVPSKSSYELHEEVPEVINNDQVSASEVLTMNDEIATGSLIYLPAEMIDTILKFLDRKNKKKLRLVNER